MDKHCPSGACSRHVFALSGSHPSSVSISLSPSSVVSIVDDWFWLVQTRLEMYPQWGPQSVVSLYNWRRTAPHGFSHDIHRHTKSLQQWTKQLWLMTTHLSFSSGTPWYSILHRIFSHDPPYFGLWTFPSFTIILSLFHPLHLLLILLLFHSLFFFLDNLTQYYYFSYFLSWTPQ